MKKLLTVILMAAMVATMTACDKNTSADTAAPAESGVSSAQAGSSYGNRSSAGTGSLISAEGNPGGSSTGTPDSANPDGNAAAAEDGSAVQAGAIPEADKTGSAGTEALHNPGATAAAQAGTQTSDSPAAGGSTAGNTGAEPSGQNATPTDDNDPEPGGNYEPAPDAGQKDPAPAPAPDPEPAPTPDPQPEPASEPAPAPAPAPAPSEPAYVKTAYGRPFDTTTIRNDMIAYGLSKGLILNESLYVAPDQSAAGGGFNCPEDTTNLDSNDGQLLKRGLFGKIDGIIRQLGADGLQFNVYCQPVGEGEYWIYVLYS